MYDVDRVRFFESVATIEASCAVLGRASQTTKRFREAVLHYLLDNHANGPIVEVGTLHGGMTVLLAAAGKSTGRHVYAVDIEPHRIEETRDTCARMGVGGNVTVFCGQLKTLMSECPMQRPDLILLDSDHSYKVTFDELIIASQMKPRAIALHDFNYRQGKQEALFADLPNGNPVAVDRATMHFVEARSEKPVIVRIGAHSHDGTTNTFRNRGGHDDFIAAAGTEGAILIWP